jgi:hypothetical protein
MKRIIIICTLLLACFAVQAQTRFFMLQAAAGGGGGGTLERTWKAKPANQYMGTTQWSGWSGMPGTGDNTIPAGTSWLLRDITNSNASSITFVATDAWTGSSGSMGTNGTGTADGGIFCLDQLTMHGWETTAASVVFKITGLTAGKYYDIGIYANSENFRSLSQSVAFSSGGSIASYSTGNNYGACGPGDDLDDPAVKWVTNQQPTAGEITVTITRTAGTGIVLSGVFVKQYSGSH